MSSTFSETPKDIPHYERPPKSHFTNIEQAVHRSLMYMIEIYEDCPSEGGGDTWVLLFGE